MSPSSLARLARLANYGSALPKLLHIDSSPRGAASVTRRLSAHFVARWVEQAPGGVILRRDLAAPPPPHPTPEVLEAAVLAVTERTPAQQAVAAHADALLVELEQADVVLLGAPVYNFSVPSALKAWFDLVNRPGRTFRYGSNGHEGLLSGRLVVAITARGGQLEPVTPGGDDLQAALIRSVFGFMGIADVRFVHVEGQDIDPKTAAAGEQRARATIDRMFGAGLAVVPGPAASAAG